jgi:transcriptional regulator with XRE-family HTH domain
MIAINFFLDKCSLSAYSAAMNDTAATRTKELYIGIGERIRQLRQDKNLSLNELARKVGFAKSYLSQIENLKREPSISALSQIAHVLEVDVLFLLSGEIQNQEVKSFTIVKKGERKTVNRPSGSLAYIYDSITYKKPDRLMEGYIVTMGFEFPPEPFIHEGQELVYGLEGTHEFVYEGKTYLLEEGDCYYFDSNKPHYGRAIGEKPGKLLVVFTAKRD